MNRTISYWSSVSMTLKGAPAFEVKSVHGTENLGELFHYTITLQTPDSPDLTEVVTANLSYKQMVGKEAGITIELDGGGQREINGLVTSARFLHAENRRSIYEVTLRPWLVLATRTSDYKIFQQKTVIDIAQEVLADYPFLTELRLSSSYPQRVFQTQYGETDFDLLSRLFQEWGIYYFFEHQGGKHKLILVDDAGAHQPCTAPYANVNFYGPSAKIMEEYCQHFNTQESLQSGQWVSDDFDFTKPRARLQQKVKMPRNTGNKDFELYKWPGDFTDPGEGRDLARTRMEEAGAPGSRSWGSGNLRGVVTGKTFKLAKHPQDKANQNYLVIGTTLSMRENSHAAGEEGYACHCEFQLQPANNVYRSPQTQPKPLTTGPQTAIVTGPAGQEIYTNEYGQVKVSFHWNRYCTKDENSSCWIRVSNPWAGSNFGAIAIPRIGQELIVDFENGDPDRPIITGRVYNALNMPPWGLPANMTQSGILTRSSMDGAPGAGMKNGPGDANALRFEDKKGQEQLWLHAQKDQLTEVEHDEDKWVGNDRRKVIDRDEFNTIHRDRTEIVDRNELINVHGWRTEEVDLDETITIHKNRTKTVDISESDSIGKNWSHKTGKMKNELVGIGYTQSTGVFKMVNIGVAYNLNVGLAMMTNVGVVRSDTVGKSWSQNTGSDHSHTVGTVYSLNVGAGGGGGGAASGPGAPDGGGCYGGGGGGDSAGGSEGGGGGGSGSSITMDATTITLKVGQSILTMKEDGTVTVNGHDLSITMTGQQVIKADDTITIKGAKIFEN